MNSKTSIMNNPIMRGAGKRVLGVAEFELNTAKKFAEILGSDTKKIDELKKLVAMGQKEADRESEGRGWGGFAGEVAGDPLTYVGGGLGKEALSKAGRLAKALNLMGAGAQTGLTAGLTQGTSDEKSSIGSNVATGVTGAGIGALFGLGTPAAAGAVKTGYNTVKGIGLRIAAAAGSKQAGDIVGSDIIAKQLIKDGYAPEEILVLIQKSNELGQTLGELTQSPGVLQLEKQIIRGTGKGSRTMRDTLDNRAKSVIPAAIQKRVDTLSKAGEEADPLYKAAADESDALQANLPKIEKTQQVKSPIVDEFGNEILSNKVVSSRNESLADNSVSSIKKTIDSRLKQLGEAPTLERTVLLKAQKILENAEKQGATFDSILDAKKQLGEIFIENADHGVQTKANSYTVPFAKQLDQKLLEMAPENYQKGKTAAMQTMAARDLSGALDESRVGGIRQLYNKLWATPELREDFLRKVPQENHADFKNLFQELDNVSRGFGGSDTAFNIPAGQKLEGDVIGFNPDISNPLNTIPSMARNLGDFFYPEVSEGIVRSSMTPSDRIPSSMIRRNQTVLDSSLVEAPAQIGTVGSIDGMNTRRVREEPSKPENPFLGLSKVKSNPFLGLGR